MRVSNKLAKTTVKELNFSTRTYNCLRRAGITNVGELWDAYKAKRLGKIRNFGHKCMKEVEEKLNEVM